MYHPSNIYSYTFTCNCTIQISADAWYLLPHPPLDEATPSSAAARKWQSPQASGIWATRMEIGKTWNNAFETWRNMEKTEKTMSCHIMNHLESSYQFMGLVGLVTWVVMYAVPFSFIWRGWDESDLCHQRNGTGADSAVGSMQYADVRGRKWNYIPQKLFTTLKILEISTPLPLDPCFIMFHHVSSCFSTGSIPNPPAAAVQGRCSTARERDAVAARPRAIHPALTWPGPDGIGDFISSRSEKPKPTSPINKNRLDEQLLAATGSY